MTNKLAIIIPAYKADFFRETLESIASQTCKDFVLYIGDDASPYHLQDIVKDFEERIDIRYKKFEENLGSTDLIAQWERCIELSKQEQWIWLFSDDDLMDKNCVEKFYDALQRTGGEYNLYRFNTIPINHLNNVIGDTTKNPVVESSIDFLTRKLNRQTNSYAVEYIFKRNTYKKNNGFIKFPSAWASDDATWARYGNDGEIYTISGPIIKWRYSGQNLSSKHDPKLSIQKLAAILQFINWSKKEFGSQIPDKVLLDWSLFQFSLLEKLNFANKIWFQREIILKTQISIKQILIYNFITLKNQFRNKIRQLS